MCMRYYLFLIGIFLSVNLNAVITTASLLREMVDRESMVCYPAVDYKLKQYSSYDRASKSPELPGWFGNDDRNMFIRTEYNNGRREYVMFESNKPGAIVRFWATVLEYKGNATLRFYIDGNTQPVLQGELISLIGNGGVVGSPLSASVAPTTTLLQRGQNLYLPIPYSSSCKITLESPHMVLTTPSSGECVYYAINYREYDKSTHIESFKMSDVTHAYKALTDSVNNVLKLNQWRMPIESELIADETIRIEPNSFYVKELSGSAAIHRLSLKLNAKDINKSLRSTLIRIEFDNKETVVAPVGDFFGTGYKLSPFSSWYGNVLPDGTMTAYWIMPFSQSCRISFFNHSDQNVTIQNFNIVKKKRDWDSLNDLYFAAYWFEEYQMETMRQVDASGRKDFFDLNYLNVTGKGKLVGTGLTLFNPADSWWGEGDEKIYVDDESFPSNFGTGTEDYFGYAWCLPAVFIHPFIAQPDGSGNLTAGYSVNFRHRVLDAIPFKQCLKFDMEIMHWSHTKMNYAPITYYYIDANSIPSVNNVVAEQAKRKVALNRTDILSNELNGYGEIEFENMPSVKNGGDEVLQYIFNLGWSNDTQSWFLGNAVGSSVEYAFHVPVNGSYPISINITKAADYAIYDVFLNGTLVKTIDAYSTFLTTEMVNLGNHAIINGENKLKIIIKGKNPNAIGGIFMTGLDKLKINDISSEKENELDNVLLQIFNKNIQFRGVEKGWVQIFSMLGTTLSRFNYLGIPIDLGHIVAGSYVVMLSVDGEDKFFKTNIY